MADVVIKIKGDTKDYERSLKSVKDLTKKGIEPATSETQKLGTATENYGNTSGKWFGLSKGSALAVATALGTLLVASSKFSAEFESSMAMVSTLFGDVEVDVGNLNKEMLRLSNETGVSAKVLGDSLYQGLSAGVEVTEDMVTSMTFLEKSTKLAIGSGAQLTSVVDAQTSVMNAYKMETTSLDKVQKIFLQTQNKGKTTVAELAQSLSNVTGFAAAAGLSFEQVGAAMATMTAQGTPTSKATTQLTQLLSELGKSGTKASDSLISATKGTEYAGKSFSELLNMGVPLNEILDMMAEYATDSGTALQDLFGSIEAGGGALQLSGQNSEAFADNLTAMGTEADVVAQAFDIMSNTVEQKMNKLKESSTNALITIGQAVEPFAKLLIDGLTLLVDNIEYAIPLVAGLVAGLTAYKIALGISGVVGGLTSSMQAFFTLMKSGTILTNLMTVAQMAWNAVVALNPLAIIIGLIAGLGVALVTLWNTSEDFRNGLINIWDNIKSFVGGTIEGLITMFFDFAGKMSRIPIEIYNAIAKVMSDLASGVINIGGSVINSIKDMFGGLWDFVKEFPNNFFNVGKDIVNGIFNGIKSAWDGLTSGFSNLLSGLVGGVKKFLKINSPSKKFGDEVGAHIPTGIGAGMQKSMPRLLSISKKQAQEIQNAYSSVINGIKGKAFGFSGLVGSDSSVSNNSTTSNKTVTVNQTFNTKPVSPFDSYKKVVSYV